MTVNMRNYHIDEKNKILNIDLQCESGKEHKAGKIRFSLVFEGSCGKRYFPVSAQYQQEIDDCRRYMASVRIELPYIFFEHFPLPEEKVTVSAVFCNEDMLWINTASMIELPGELFQPQERRRSAIREISDRILYIFCTILLPVWILDGVLAQKGLHRLHRAADGRQGKQAVFYHAHGLVKDWTGYGYSIREYKTNYFKKCYERARRNEPGTKGILFLSERRVDAGGNLDRIRQEVQKKGYVSREFLTETPIHKLSRKEIRRCAGLVAAAKLIILEDFVPQLHSLSLRRDTQLLQMWHACGAFKLFGLSELGIVDHLNQSTRNHRSYTAALASSDGVVPFYSEAFGVDDHIIKPIGVPRTDIFFDQKYASQVRERFFQKYPACQNKKIVLFAPTFRGSGNKTAYYPWEKFPAADIMDQLPQDTVMILKNHPFVKKTYEIPLEYQERIFDLSAEENINDLLFIASVLITDYSSVIFEASLLNLPIVFYTFDLQEYLDSRDIYFDFASFAPGKIVGDRQTLEKEIMEILQGEGEETKERSISREQFCRFFLGSLDGKSTERTMELVKQLLTTD